MVYIELHDTGQNSVTLKSNDLCTHGFQKKFQTHPLKSAEASERSACPLQNYLRFSWLIRGVRERGGGILHEYTLVVLL